MEQLIVNVSFMKQSYPEKNSFLFHSREIRRRDSSHS